MKRILIFLFLALLILPNASALAGTPSGSWSGFWASSTYPGDRGTTSCTLTMTGSNVTGNVYLKNTAVGSVSTDVSGSVSGSTITLRGTYYYNGYLLQLEVVIPSSIDNTANGTYTIRLSGSVYDRGTWTLHRRIVTFTASCTYGGTISPSGNITIDYGGRQSFVITANDDYVIKDVNIVHSAGGLAGPSPVNGLKTATYSFSPTYDDVTIHAVFEKLPSPPQPSDSVALSPILQLLLSSETKTFAKQVQDILDTKGYDQTYTMTTTWDSFNTATARWHYSGALPAAGYVGSNKIELTGTDPVDNNSYQFTIDTHGRNWQGQSGLVVLYKDTACTIPIGYYEWTIPTGILNSISFGNLTMRTH